MLKKKIERPKASESSGSGSKFSKAGKKLHRDKLLPLFKQKEHTENEWLSHRSLSNKVELFSYFPLFHMNGLNVRIILITWPRYSNVLTRFTFLSFIVIPNSGVLLLYQQLFSQFLKEFLRVSAPWPQTSESIHLQMICQTDSVSETSCPIWSNEESVSAHRQKHAPFDRWFHDTCSED